MNLALALQAYEFILEWRLSHLAKELFTYIGVRARLLLCISIPGSVASANRFSSCVVRQLLLCVNITVDSASTFMLACQPNSVLVENADTC